MPDFTHMDAFMHRQKRGAIGLFLKIQMTQFTLLCVQPKPMQTRLTLLFFQSLDTLGVYLNRTSLNLVVVRGNEIYTVA